MANAGQTSEVGQSVDTAFATIEPPLTAETVKRLKAAGNSFGLRKDKRISGRISCELLAAAKQRLGVASDTETIELALVNMALADDYGAWLVAQAGRLDTDFRLEL